MIENDEQLRIQHEQLMPLYLALASQRREILPMNPRKYGVFSEGFVDQIREMRGEIDAYLGLHQAEPPQERSSVAVENEEQLERTHQAIGILHQRLAALRKEVGLGFAQSSNASRVIDEIVKLQAEIDAYLGLNQAVAQPAALHENPPDFGSSKTPEQP